jgi:hypothetical protein
MRSGAVNQASILSDAKEGLRSIETLRGYREFLSRARTSKAEAAGASVAFEHEVLSEARRAKEDARVLSTKALRVARHLKNAGLADAALQSWKNGVEAVGTVQLNDVLTDLLQGTRLTALQAAGLSRGAIEDIAGAVEQLQPVLLVRHGMMCLQTNRQDEEISISRRPPSGRAKTLNDLLFGNKFDAVADVFHQPSRVLADVLPTGMRSAGAGTTDPLEALLSGATLVVRDFHRHVRKLEDTGLATHHGAEGVTIALIALLVAALALVLIGGILMCDEDDAECMAGALLLMLGMLLFGAFTGVSSDAGSHELGLTADGTAIRIPRTDVEGAI